jgi:glucokinase
VSPGATDYVVGLDVGGTRLKSGAVSRTGKLLASGIAPTDAHKGAAAMLRCLRAEVDRLANQLGARPRAVGVGLPGAVDPARGIVLLAGRLRGLEGFPLVPRLARAVDAPVVAENDGRLSMVAEAHHGLARRKKWAVSITLGTGVGSGVLLDGRILRDPHRQFGTQLSHIVLDVSHRRLCLTGARGTAEMLCSATALAIAVRDGLQRGVPSRLSDLYLRDPQAIDFAAVARAAGKGDRLCKDEFEQWTERLGWLLVSAVHAYAPEIIILAGGAAHAARQFLRPLQAHVDAHIFRWPRGSRVPIRISRLGDHANVMGAAKLAWDLVQA